jgi:hypothetical protein
VEGALKHVSGRSTKMKFSGKLQNNRYAG